MKKRWFYFAGGACIIIVASIVTLIWVSHSEPTTNTTHYTPAQQTATAIPQNEHQVVNTYNQAMIKQDWAAIYASASTGALGGYTQGEFSQLMAQQVQKNGSIVSITPLSNSINPEIKTNADHITYFSIIEKVIIDKSGISETAMYGVTFILENGAWKFFTSTKIQ
jgi:hypothetical protein